MTSSCWRWYWLIETKARMNLMVPIFTTWENVSNNQLLQSKWNPLHQNGLWIAPHYHHVSIWSYIPIYIWLGEYEEYPQHSKSSSILMRFNFSFHGVSPTLMLESILVTDRFRFKWQTHKVMVMWGRKMRICKNRVKRIGISRWWLVCKTDIGTQRNVKDNFVFSSGATKCWLCHWNWIYWGLLVLGRSGDVAGEKWTSLHWVVVYECINEWTNCEISEVRSLFIIGSTKRRCIG